MYMRAHSNQPLIRHRKRHLPNMKALTLVPPEMPCPIHLRSIRANIIKLLATIIARDPLGRVARRFSADFDEDIDVVFAPAWRSWRGP